MSSIPDSYINAITPRERAPHPTPPARAATPPPPAAGTRQRQRQPERPARPPQLSTLDSWLRRPAPPQSGPQQPQHTHTTQSTPDHATPHTTPPHTTPPRHSPRRRTPRSPTRPHTAAPPAQRARVGKERAASPPVMEDTPPPPRRGPAGAPASPLRVAADVWRPPD